MPSRQQRIPPVQRHRPRLRVLCGLVFVAASFWRCVLGSVVSWLMVLVSSDCFQVVLGGCRLGERLIDRQTACSPIYLCRIQGIRFLYQLPVIHNGSLSLSFAQVLSPPESVFARTLGGDSIWLFGVALPSRHGKFSSASRDDAQSGHHYSISIPHRRRSRRIAQHDNATLDNPFCRPRYLLVPRKDIQDSARKNPTQSCCVTAITAIHASADPVLPFNWYIYSKLMTCSLGGDAKTVIFFFFL